MKKLLIAFLALVAVICCILCLAACNSDKNSNYDSNGLEYTKLSNSDAYAVGKGNFTGEEIIIPSTFKGLQVTEIKDSAFSNCDNLKSVILPESINYIGSYAFSNCSNLIEIKIPEKVKTIYYYTFYECSSLKSVILPNDLTHIKKYAFSGCNNLSKINFPSSLVEIGDYAFNSCSVLEKINLPASLTEIGEYVFSYCNGLSEITVDKQNSKYHSFQNCLIDTENKGLILGCKNSVIPNDGSVTLIQNYSFLGCSAITSISIPDCVTIIGYGAFAGCSSLTDISVPFVGYSIDDSPNTLTYSFGHMFGNREYEGGIKVQQLSRNTHGEYTVYYYIPQSLKSVTVSAGRILEGAFKNCENLESITLLDEVKDICYGAFENCISLKSINIPDKVTFIGSGAFRDCKSLANIKIGIGLEEIYYCAFEGCENLESIVFKGTKEQWAKVKKGFSWDWNTGDYTLTFSEGNTGNTGNSGNTDINKPSTTGLEFTLNGDGNSYSVTGLGTAKDKQIVIPATYENLPVTSIGIAAFSGEISQACRSLTSITIPDSVTSIGNSAFWYCSGLTSITIPDSVSSIGFGAFSYCSGLTSILIPNSLTNIEDSVFYYCSGLKSIAIPDSIISIGGGAFANCDGLTSITVGKNVTEIGDSAFYGCTKLTNITIPNNVLSIGSYAFANCNLLTSVTFENTNNWYVSTSSSGIRATSVKLTNPTQNAKYLTSTYSNYYWKRG